MATIVTYNGVEMHSVSTLRFEQHPVYDASGADVVFSRFNLSFEGLLHAAADQDGAPVWIGEASGGGGFPPVNDAYQYLMRTLWQPRAELQIDMGGETVFQCHGPSDGPDGYLDVDNGPKPKHVHLSRVTSSSSIGPTFRVTFEIECALTACPDYSIHNVLSNRWAISEGFDDEYFTTRSITGQMRVSQATLPVDAYRGLVVPALEKNFKRVRFDYNIHADGLVIDYIVTDKQVHTSAPWPANKINVRHTEGTNNGAFFESECHVQLKGHPGASKISMFALGASILEDRLGKISNMGGDSGIVPVAFSMTDIIGEHNEVELYLKLQCAIAQDNNVGLPPNPVNFLGLPVGTLGTPLGSMRVFPTIAGDGSDGPQYDPSVSYPPALWGYNSFQDDVPRPSGILALALGCYLQYPCDDTHGISQSTNGSTTSTSGTSQTIVQENEDIPDWDTSFSLTNLQSSETQAGLYTFCAGETKVEMDPMRVGLPIAASPGAYDGKDTCVLVTLGWTQSRMHFHFECERVGLWPTIPEPIGQFFVPAYSGQETASGGAITGTLLFAQIVPLPATVDATTTKKIYHVSCRYTYQLNRPPTRGEAIPVGVLPYTNFSPASNAMLLSNSYGGANAGIYTPNTGATTNAGGY